MPRQLELQKLISVLVAEHVQMKTGLQNLRIASEAKDYISAQKVLSEIKGIFRQHIADEEARVLRVLIDAYGVKGADDAISVFRQHRPMYRLMEAIERLSGLSPEELAAKENELRGLFDEHTRAEETRIFPWALTTHAAP